MALVLIKSYSAEFCVQISSQIREAIVSRLEDDLWKTLLNLKFYTLQTHQAINCFI